jgi:hypothetical protein
MNKTIKITSFIAICGLVFSYTCGPVFAGNTAINENTGYESENSVESTVENGTVVVSVNEEEFENEGEAYVNSGDNEVEENTGISDIETGSLGIMGIFENLANMNMVDVLGGWLSDMLSLNDTTGAESENEAETETENEIEIKSENKVDAENDQAWPIRDTKRGKHGKAGSRAEISPPRASLTSNGVAIMVGGEEFETYQS